MRTAFDSAVRLLVQKLLVRKRALENRQKDRHGAPGAPILFLLGAGCSMQYGLPGYRDLLYMILSRNLFSLVPSDAKLTYLQRKLEESWALYNKTQHEAWLHEYLGGVDGRHCLGYRRLARLLKLGWIDGVINLNFDRLFDEACAAEGLDNLEPSLHCPAKIEGKILVQPHGGLGKLSAELRLRLRDTEHETFDSNNVLATSNVIVVGYGGGDDPVVEALRGSTSLESTGSLFFFNIAEISEPKSDDDVRLALRRRHSENCLSIEPSCTFENLMEAIEVGRAHLSAGEEPFEPIDAAYEHLTHSEAVALTNCRRLANRLRLTTSVGEASSASIEDHAAELSNRAFELAQAAGLRLLPVEKVLVHMVALFHDLGFYWGARHEKYGRYQGWKIHRMHGLLTASMLQGWWRENQDSLAALAPSAYRLGPTDLLRMSELVLWLCRRHSGVLRAVQNPKATLVLSLDGVETPIRRAVLRILIATAEQMALEHPFQPSLEPVGHDSATLGTIDEPVLDLFLVRRRGLVLETHFDQEKILVNVKEAWVGRAVSKFFIARIDTLLNVLSRCALEQNAGARGQEVLFQTNVEFEEWKSPAMLGFDGVQACLEEALTERVETIVPGRVDEHVALLDLLAIYCLGDRSQPGLEPRVPLTSTAVQHAMERIRACDREQPRKSLVQAYLEIMMAKQLDPVQTEFVSSFEEKIYPSWRFVGKQWHDGVEAPTTALTTLEMGSSRFRSEVIAGLRKLLRDKIEWNQKGNAWAHDGCVLCCGRLIISFSCARLLFTAQELDRLCVDFTGATLLDSLAGLVRYYLSLDSRSPRWCGATETNPESVHSSDYLAFAAGSVAYFLAVDEMVKARRGSGLDLGRRHRSKALPEKTPVALLQERWAALYQLTSGELLGAKVEDPHSLVLGRVALILLSMDYLPSEIAAAAPWAEGRGVQLVGELRQSWEVLENRPLSHLGRLNLWPVIQYLDRKNPEEALVRANFERYRECIQSPIWAHGRGDAGSWGFNVRETAVICSSLISFWRHVLFFENNRERYTPFFVKPTVPVFSPAV